MIDQPSMCRPTQDPALDRSGSGTLAEVWRLLSACFCQPDEGLFEAEIPSTLR